jgi:general secretion pathway protein K
MRFRPRHQHGYALLIVLWSLVFLSFLMVQVLGVSHTAVARAGNIRLAAQTRAAADGAIQAAAFHLLASGPAHWQPDGTPRALVLGGIAVSLRITSLAGMVNPNYAAAGLMDALLTAVAVPPDQAKTLAAAIVTWRGPPASPGAGALALDAYRRAGLTYGPPGKPFAALDDLKQVLGMTPAIYARLAPHLSLYQTGAPDRAAADPVVRTALAIAGSAGQNSNAYTGEPADAITACATGPATLCRHGVIGVSGTGGKAPFRLLALSDAQ